MRQYSVRLLPDDIHLTVADGTLLSEAIQSTGIYLTLPCGGRGACGRCIVLVDGEQRKACVTPVDADMTVEIPAAARLTGQKVLTDIRLYDPARNAAPRVEQLFLKLEEPSLENSMSDATRLQYTLAAKLGIPPERVAIEPGCLRELPAKLRERDFLIPVNFLREGEGVTVLSLADAPMYGIAVDIGTTTVVAALCDLLSGAVLDTVGLSNPQAEHGSDVISRIVYTEENEGGTETMQSLIVGALSAAIATLADRAEIDAGAIPFMTVAANTVMSHFLLGLPTDWLRREPYVPAATEYPMVRPGDLGLPILSWGRVMVIPGVSSYVGGDITAGVIATDLAAGEGLRMLVDVGTNGEIVLAGEGFLVACSSSAGPAFEGSGISCGSRAVQGAIDNVLYREGHLEYDIIGGDIAPTSVCGSGLISLISALQQKGVIDRSGHFTTAEKHFPLAPGVAITEDDIQNLIRAKGAIFAGMRVLANFMEMQLSDIDGMYIAGGFGRNLNVAYATNIGMLPLLDESRFSYVGNSSLAGALRVLCDRTVDAAAVADSILNLELSVGNEFMDEFTKACFLPHTDLSLFQKS